MVLHPLIDAMIALRNRAQIDPAAVSAIELRVHPLVLAITNVLEPATGLQSKFSLVHSAAVALLDGTAGVAQYSDAKAADPVVAALRRKTTAVADAALRADEAHAAITAGGQRHEVHIPHASGTAANPMSDAAIEAKFLGQCRAGDRQRTCAPGRRTGVVAGDVAGCAGDDRATGVSKVSVGRPTDGVQITAAAVSVAPPWRSSDGSRQMFSCNRTPCTGSRWHSRRPADVVVARGVWATPTDQPRHSSATDRRKAFISVRDVKW